MPKSSSDTAKTPTKHNFNDLDQDLIEFDRFCQGLDLDVQERVKLLQRIFSKIPQKTGQASTILYWSASILLVILVFTLAWKNWEYTSWRITALTRILMIQILPYFDWTYLKHEPCLVPKFFQGKKNDGVLEEPFNCDLCETFIDFEDFFVDQDSFDDVTEVIRQYLEVDHPVIVSGSIEHWATNSPEELLSHLLDHKEFANSVPCNFFSNFHNPKKSPGASLKEVFTKKHNFDSFFLHFQNCDLEAMKVLRNFTYRPWVVPEEIAPVTYNWLIWNRKYNPVKYKKLELIEKYALIGQMLGSTQLKLVPRKNCKDKCDVIEGVLPSGYILMFTSLWDIEYLPRGSTDNMAVMLEIQ